MKRIMCNVRIILVLVLGAALPVWAGSISIVNASFESPSVDPNAFPALPMVDGWTELDLDTQASANTGVFANPPLGSPDRLINAHDRQLAFLGSEQGNALLQSLNDYYKVGYSYELTVGIAVSGLFPP